MPEGAEGGAPRKVRDWKNFYPYLKYGTQPIQKWQEKVGICYSFFSMSLEEKIIAYKMLCLQIEDLEEQRKALGKEILSEMPQKKIEIAGYKALRYIRLAIQMPLEQARLLGVTKMEELIDKDKIKKLHSMGQKIEGVREIAYLVVSASSLKKPSGY